MTDQEKPKEEARIINAEHIVEPPNPNRVEINDEKLKELAQSIKEIGLQQPLVVRPIGNKFEIVAGHRRFKACLLAGVINISCIVKTLTNDEAEQVKAHENLYRSNLSVTEEAIYLSRLINKDTSKIPEAARIVGQTEEWVKKRLEILEYPEYFWPALDSEQISLGVARALALIEDETYRKMFFDMAIRDGMKVWVAEHYYAQWKAGIFKKSEDILPPSETERPGAPAVIRQPCAKCGGVATAPNLTNTFIHIECPSDINEPPAIVS